MTNKNKSKVAESRSEVKMPELSFHAVLKVAPGPGVILHLQGSRSIFFPIQNPVFNFLAEF
jgi:hypothetical protein